MEAAVLSQNKSPASDTNLPDVYSNNFKKNWNIEDLSLTTT